MAVEGNFGAHIDYAMVIKIFSGSEAERERYGPGDVVEVTPTPVSW
jgi:hypothetical protein